MKSADDPMIADFPEVSVMKIKNLGVCMSLARKYSRSGNVA